MTQKKQLYISVHLYSDLFLISSISPNLKQNSTRDSSRNEISMLDPRRNTKRNSCVYISVHLYLNCQFVPSASQDPLSPQLSNLQAKFHKKSFLQCNLDTESTLGHEKERSPRLGSSAGLIVNLSRGIARRRIWVKSNPDAKVANVT